MMFLFGLIVAGCFAQIACIFMHVDVHVKEKVLCIYSVVLLNMRTDNSTDEEL